MRIFISLLLFLASCAENKSNIINKSLKILNQQNMTQKVYVANGFNIFTLQKIANHNDPIRIYVEGDGFAYINEDQPSSNPTPRSYFLMHLIAQDNSSNIVYIARPCQYLWSEKCSEKYWTSARFSPEVIDSIDEVIKNFSEYKLELVAYSGGAEIVNQIALRSKNISSIRTISGNLDHRKFCEIHEVPYLAESISQIDDYSFIEKIPQIHFVGAKDKIVLPIIAKEFVEKFSNKNCAQIFQLENASHYDGWSDEWNNLLKLQPKCFLQ